MVWFNNVLISYIIQEIFCVINSWRVDKKSELKLCLLVFFLSFHSQLGLPQQIDFNRVGVDVSVFLVNSFVCGEEIKSSQELLSSGGERQTYRKDQRLWLRQLQGSKRLCQSHERDERSVSLHSFTCLLFQHVWGYVCKWVFLM